VADSRDYYSILQVNKRASAEDIDRSFERLSKLYDPAQSKKRRATERWSQIKEAYETLSDPAKRAEYDRSLNPRRLPGIGGQESAITRFLTGTWGLPSIAALIGGIVIAAVAVAVFAGGGDDAQVADITTPAPSFTAAPTLPPITGEETTTASGLKYVTITEGTGASPASGDSVIVHYTGWLQSDGSQFDSSVGGDPFQTTVGVGSVIAGWDEGLPLMKEGGKTRLIIPPDLGYGETGSGDRIPPNSTLVFDIELLDVVKPGETPMPTPTAAPPSATPTTAPSGSATPTPASPSASATPEPTS
jgi:peptidylprolyl isomerase